MHLPIEGIEDLLAVHAERVQERRHRNLAAAIDARMDDILGVELDVQPRAAIGNDAGGEQQLAGGMGLALVVVEEYARRAVHLRDDHPLGAIDDEGAVHRHERYVAHVDILLLDVLDRFRSGLLVDIEHDQPQRHLERGRIGHAPLPALVDIVFGRLELVLDEFKHRGVGKIRDREHGFEHRLQALVGPAADRLAHQQELVVGRLLNLDEVRHLRDFLNFSEKLANALATCKRLRHLCLSPRRTVGTGTTLRKAAIHRDHQDRRRGTPLCMCDSARHRIDLSRPPGGLSGNSGPFRNHHCVRALARQARARPDPCLACFVRSRLLAPGSRSGPVLAAGDPRGPAVPGSRCHGRACPGHPRLDLLRSPGLRPGISLK